MGRPRIYTDDAERQRAHRQKKRDIQVSQNAVVPNPALRWLGGKWRLAEWIINTFPKHICYCEPFGGGANVLLQKEPSRLEVYNDLDGDIVNFFSVLRGRRDELIEQIELTPFARDELLLSSIPSADPLERARRFYVKCWQAFQPGSGYDSSPSWRFQKSWARGKSSLDEWNRVGHLLEVAARFKLVQVENRPAEEVISRFDEPTTLFYVDPPYLESTRTMATQSRYRYEMSDEDHQRLAALLRKVQGMVIVSGYGSKLYDDLYRGWTRMSKTTTTNGNSVSVEYLWLSPSVVDAKHLPLFAAQS